MVSFRKTKHQAEHVVKQHLKLGQARHGNQGKPGIHSVRTASNYQQALKQVGDWLNTYKLGSLKDLDTATAIQYLEARSVGVKQKTLNQERQALQLLLKIKLPVVKSEIADTVKSRAYTKAQIELIAQAQTEKYRLATQ